MATVAEKSAAFRALHERPGAFVIPNPRDAGTARLLASTRSRMLQVLGQKTRVVWPKDVAEQRFVFPRPKA
jgi:hypothetical protein